MEASLITSGPTAAITQLKYSLTAGLLAREDRVFDIPVAAGHGNRVTRQWRYLPTVLLLVACLAVPSAAVETSTTRLRQQTRELLRQEATVADGAAHDAVVAALCDMYVILRIDARYSTSEMLRGDAMQVRRRLISIARRREGALRRAGVPRPSELSADVDSAIESALSEGHDLPADRLRPQAQGGGAFQDEGWRLVELIERVVAPDFWDNRGGPGTIRYFAMRRVLVVRATTDVHEQIKDLLMALR